MKFIDEKAFTIIIFISVTLFTLSIKAQNISFRNYLVKDGLSNNKINCILEDDQGFIWLGTEDGLNRFDGYNFKVYRNLQGDPSSISSNKIWALFEDKEGYIWIGTKGGELNRYDPISDSFTNWKIDDDKFSENSITAIYRDKGDNVWVGTYRNGLYRLNIKTGDILNWNYDPSNKNSLSNNFITAIVMDPYEKLWISTYNGLNIFDVKSSKEIFNRIYLSKIVENLNTDLIWKVDFSKFDKTILYISSSNGLIKHNINSDNYVLHNFPDRKELQFSNSISSVAEQKINNESILWIGTYAGLIRKNLNSSKTKRFVANQTKSNDLISNQINEILIDRSGVLWIAQEEGLSCITDKSFKFDYSLFENKYSSLEQLTLISINAVCQTADGKIWFGGPKGIYLYNPDKPYNLEKLKVAANLIVWSLCPGNHNDIWIGTYGQGLKQLDIFTGNIKDYKIESPTLKTSAFEYIKSLFLTENNELWIGFWGGGIAKLNTKTGGYKIFFNEPGDINSLSYNDVWAIHQDKLGRIWIGTNGGGINFSVDENPDEFNRIKSQDNYIKNIGSLNINCIFEGEITSANETVLWFGTSDGLLRLIVSNDASSVSQNSFVKDLKIFTIKDGLADNSINSIVNDDNGNLWLGTNSGLTFYNIKNNSFYNYDYSDGLNGDAMSLNCAIKLKDGAILFGSPKGVNIFYPSIIKKSEFIPNIVLTGFFIFNEEIKAGKNSILSNHINFTDKINIKHSQNVFSFQFSALDFNSPKSIKYAYMMEGFDDNWISSNRRFITYTNLDPGKYTFKVKSTNSDGIWFDNVKSISIIISPPWWRTIWAYFAYFIIIVVGILLIRRTEMNRNRLRNELKIREIEAEKLRDVEKIKSRFFANLSHEFRTPLLLIKGPVEQLENNPKIDSTNQIQLIKRNAEKLQTLIDQLLELSQLESDAIPLRSHKENIIPIIKGIFYSFESLAIKKNIKIIFDSELTEIMVWFDRDKLEKILNNLLSNAFKFTGENGKIELLIKIDYQTEKKNLIIAIKDSGIGIPPDEIKNIFERFYQVDNTSTRKYPGSGIGLSLVKELVELHRWNISVSSQEGFGTVFKISIPTSDNYLDDDQKFDNTKIISNINNTNQKTELLSLDNTNLVDISNPISKSTKQTILIVEDSEDVRLYLVDILKENYNLSLAENGEIGLKKVLDISPDLIISDVMMPQMDGIEFCKRVKSNWQSSHIPVILLTAKATPESKIEGLETGADDYLTKPFSYRELSVRIKNLLEQRRLLKEKFSKDLNLKPENISNNPADREFIEKLYTIVNKNLSEPLFDSERLAESVFLSRSQLHRKIQAITGQSTGEFIRTLRLKRAAEMILEKKFSFTQISYEVGFNSPSHFTKAFKQFFGCLPSEFVNKSNS